jgi:hypothetical protein
MALITDDPITGDPQTPLRPSPLQEPEQGVIEEARRRQHRRRTRMAIGGLLAAILIGAIVWALGGASHASPGQSAGASHARLAYSSDVHAAAFNVRLVPVLKVGQAGWCTVNEENGVTGTSSCGGLPTSSEPFLQIDGWGNCGSGHETEVAVTDPQVSAVAAGTLQVATVPLPGLPYGLRGARIVSPHHESARGLPSECLSGGQSPTLVALDAQGHPISQRWTNTPRQASVHSWRYPNQPPRGLCQLHAGGVPGLSARMGQVATTIRAFPGQLVGHAFLACISTTYSLHGLPVRAMILLDAAHPGAQVAALPDFKPVSHAPGFYVEGGLVARHSGDAWLVVAQGSGLAQRMHVLSHLTGDVKL